MDLFLFVFLYTSCIGGSGYVFMNGDPDEPGAVNCLNRLLTRDLVNAVRWCLFKCFGDRGVGAYDAFEEYICWSANPLLQVFYLGMILSGFVGFVVVALPFVPCEGAGVPCWPAERAGGTTDFLPAWHRLAAYVTMATCLLSWCACCWSEPGSATPESPLSVYCFAWDGFVHTRKVCPTTRLVRPARSTYCRYTDKLVLRFDHFCPWIKNAVGENNYRYFLFFLFMHWLTLGYASWGCAWMLLHRLEEERFWSRTDGLAQIYDPVSGEPRNISWGEVFRVALMLENKVTLLAMFCFFLAIVVFAFWAYHIWLTATNMTTNEAIKRGRVRARIQSAYEDEDEMVLDELKAMAGIDSSDEEPVADASTTKKRPGKGGAKGEGKGKGPKASSEKGPKFGIRKLPQELGYMDRFEDVIMKVPFMLRVMSGLFSGTVIGGYVGFVFLEWNFVWGGLVSVATGGIAAAAVGGIPFLLGWGRPHIHMPNPYDRGLIGNFGEVFFPRSARADAVAVSDAPTEMKIVPEPVVARPVPMSTAVDEDLGKEQ